MAQPAARFIDPPFRRETGTIFVGVACWSRFGIASVQVTASDGTSPDVVNSATTYSWNIDNDDWIWCFNVEIDLSSLNDGPVTLTALVTDGSSNTRTISHDINNNTGGTLRFHEAWVDAVLGNDGTGTIDSAGSQPFATIMAAADAFGLANDDDHDPGGCVIYLEEGSHHYGDYAYGQNIESQSPDWLRITKAPGATRDNVKIVFDAHGGDPRLLHLVR